VDNSETPPAEKPLHWSTKARLAREAAAKERTVSGSAPMPDHVTADAASPTPPDERQTLNEEIARIRKMRKPFGAFTQKLALATRPGYHRHWFNDVPGRIDEAKLSGWTHVTDDKGQPVKRIVGTGRDKGALYAFAMEIPQVFWEEDQAAQFARAKAPMDAIKSSPIQAKPGTAKAQDNEKFYSPREQVLSIENK
jgi:hypothetical protein